MEDAGLRWPQHCVKGFDYVIPADDARRAHRFEGVAALYLNTRTRVQPDTLLRPGAREGAGRALPDRR
ncbi:MAG: hypothetical protein ACXVXO_13660 [Mycobacteriaceae bacterium]